MFVLIEVPNDRVCVLEVMQGVRGCIVHKKGTLAEIANAADHLEAARALALAQRGTTRKATIAAAAKSSTPPDELPGAKTVLLTPGELRDASALAAIEREMLDDDGETD